MQLQPVPGKRRIHVANDSSSDESNSPEKTQSASKYQQLLSVKDREELLIAVKKQEPDYDTMVQYDEFFVPNTATLQTASLLCDPILFVL